MLKIYNTATGKKENFTPINPEKIGVYICGMTVYDYCHIGHARVIVMFDMIVAQLRRQFPKVTYVRNITDIDDKIIQRAIQNNEDIYSLTTRFIAAMHEDEKALCAKKPDIEPKATQHIDAMLYLVQTLIDKDLAYQADNGDVYFCVRKFPKYGKLSGKNLDDLQSGARVDIDGFKRDPLDFVLWKATKPENINNPNDPSWNTNWGAGRPGWHLECSAMSGQYLGNHFDIHGGGMDLVFPHHENEIAQSKGAHNDGFANYWLHVGFVNIDEEKMSKSLGNFTTIRNALKHYQGEVLRYFIISSHYRSPLNYSEQNLINAKTALTRLYTGIRSLSISEAAMIEVAGRYDFEARFFDALEDDFNTPMALAVLFDLLKTLNTAKNTDIDQAKCLAQLLRTLAAHLGLLQDEKNFFTHGISLSDNDIDTKIQQRNQARIDKDFALSDKIRDALNQADILLEDGANGTTWRRK